MIDPPYEIVNKIFCEVYPFSEKEIAIYKEFLDFKSLSRNRNIEWDYTIIKRFEHLWDWEVLDRNRSVFDKLTLGLLFPEKTTLPECDCFRNEDFCENMDCAQIFSKFSVRNSLYETYPELYMNIDLKIQSKYIEQSMVKKFYNSKKPDDLLIYKIKF